MRPNRPDIALHPYLRTNMNTPSAPIAPSVSPALRWLAWAAAVLACLAVFGMYTVPDFMVMLADGQLQAHEVKGYWTDDARVKIKVAAALFPIEFIAIKKKAKKDGGGWEKEMF